MLLTTDAIVILLLLQYITAVDNDILSIDNNYADNNSINIGAFTSWVFWLAKMQAH